MRHIIALAITSLVCSGCVGAPQRDAPRTRVESAAALNPDSTEIHIRGPTLIAFHPSVTQAQLDSSEELSTVLDDFGHHLSAAADSLHALGIVVEDRPTGPIQLVEHGGRRQFIPAKDSGYVGYAFVAPGRRDRVYYRVMTHSDLIATAHEFLRAKER